MIREWATSKEIADAQGKSVAQINRDANKEDWSYQDETLPGGGTRRRFFFQSLPMFVQLAVIRADQTIARKERPEIVRPVDASAAWTWFDYLPAKKRDEAAARLVIINDINAMVRAGSAKNGAVTEIARRNGRAPSSVWSWMNRIAYLEPSDWLPALVDRRDGGDQATSEVTPEAWEMIKSDWLRPERPTFSSCYWRLERAAKDKGWTIPSSRTLLRRMEKEVPRAVATLARKGQEAARKMYPAQERDRSMFHALEAVNADGHKWDVWVRWPDGTEGRVMMVAIQDLYSGMILSYRLDRTENRDAVRLAFGDMVERYGIPSHTWLDNGRSFANKWLTGGTPTRFRFKVRDEDPAGILVQLGIQVHWATPYSGQSKPIERAFKDMCDTIAKHPAFSGSWVGNNTMNKPDYMPKAVDFALFERVVAEEIAAHNARPNRQSRVCAGRSLERAFAESYATAPIRKALPEQRRLWLLAAESVRAAAPDGAIHLEGNRYWANFLPQLIGEKVVIRFDPDHFHDGVHVYQVDGAYLGPADCIEAVGFADAEAARTHGRARKAFMRGLKDQLEAERTLTGLEIAANLPRPAPLPMPETRVIRPDFRPALATRPVVETVSVEDAARAIAAAAATTMAEIVQLQAPTVDPLAEERRFIEIGLRLKRGEPVDEFDRDWFTRQERRPSMRAALGMYEEFGEQMFA